MDEFDSIFDEDDPPASRFGSGAQFDAWRHEGGRIAAAIRAALGPDETLDVVLPDGLGPT